MLAQGGADSDYSISLYQTYKFPTHLKSLKTLTATAGWCRAVTDVQLMLAAGKIRLRRPTMVLSSHADEVLRKGDIDDLSDMLTQGPQGERGQDNDGHHRPLWSKELVEREVETTPEHPSAHDVLAAPSQQRVEEALQLMLMWLASHFPRHTV